jgi:hypothetical protein
VQDPAKVRQARRPVHGARRLARPRLEGDVGRRGGAEDGGPHRMHGPRSQRPAGVNPRRHGPRRARHQHGAVHERGRNQAGRRAGGRDVG